jgi:hypothetical protein
MQVVYLRSRFRQTEREVHLRLLMKEEPLLSSNRKPSSRLLDVVLVEMRRFLLPSPRGPLCTWDHNTQNQLLTCITRADILKLHFTGWIRHNLHALPFEVPMICFGYHAGGASLCAS